MDQRNPTREPAPPEKGRGPSGKIANSLVALSSAAVLTVYAAGYLRTRSAAARFAVEAADLRTAGPVAGAPVAAAPPLDFSDVRQPSEVAVAAPARVAPAPKDEAAVAASTSKPAESALPALVADSAAPTTEPAPIEESPAPSAVAARTDAAPAAVESAKAEPPAPTPPPPDRKYKDGTFSGWGYSRHGDIEAAVVVQDGRVISAEITQCLTRYSCSVIDMLPAQVLTRQNPFVDLISGATESANAYSNAIFRALVSSQKALTSPQK